MARRRSRLSLAALRMRVEKRAGGRCEYCHAPQSICGYRYHLEHIIPLAQGGSDSPANRALAYAACNLAKSDQATGVDPETDREVLLFNPRTQTWREHFRWAHDRETLLGRTPTGRATVAALDMNSSLRKEARRLWFETGWLP